MADVRARAWAQPGAGYEAVASQPAAPSHPVLAADLAVPVLRGVHAGVGASALERFATATLTFVEPAAVVAHGSQIGTITGPLLRLAPD